MDDDVLSGPWGGVIDPDITIPVYPEPPPSQPAPPPTQANGALDALTGSLTYALNRYVDAEFIKRWRANDPGAFQYTVSPSGQISMRGQPASIKAAAASPLVVFGLIALGGLVIFHLLKD